MMWKSLSLIFGFCLVIQWYRFPEVDSLDCCSRKYNLVFSFSENAGGVRERVFELLKLTY